MDLLVRHKSAAENVDQTVEAETQDHMDHTYGCLRMCGTRTRMVQRKLTAQRGDHCPAPPRHDRVAPRMPARMPLT